MDQRRVYDIVNAALEKLVRKDSFLLEYDANERTITHRLAIYLAEELHDWDVDCEYNRHIHAKKEIVLRLINQGYTELLQKRYSVDEMPDSLTVFPDIVVHHRGTDDSNLLVIEAKKTSSTAMDDEFDRCKLIAYKSQFGYRFAAFIRFCSGDKPGFEPPEWL